MTREEKVKKLIAISKIARIQAQETGETVNEILIELYTTEEHEEFKTLNMWNKEGYRVKKGEEAFLVWGKPKKGDDQEEKPVEPTEEDIKKGKFWPMAYLFSNAQVIKR
jgi:hypothetical protein